MTTSTAISIERLAQHVELETDAPEKIESTARELRRALEIEDHVAIAVFDDDLAFLLRGVALKLAGAALAEQDGETAELLMVWARDGIPRGEREVLVDIVVSAKKARAK
jgi:hypothetical protein